MTAFEAAVGALFADPNLSVTATWMGIDGYSAPVRVIRRRPDAVTDYAGGRFVTDTTIIEVAVADVAELKRGDAFVIGAETFTVIAAPTRDVDRLIWRAEARP